MQQSTTLTLVGVAASAMLVLGGEAQAATGQYVDGPIELVNTVCTGTGNQVEGTASYIGWYADPAEGLPQLGEVSYIHAVAMNMNPCGGNFAGFEIMLPEGAELAEDRPVACFVGNGSVSGNATCAKHPQLGVHGGLWFGQQYGIAPGWAYELQIPIRFTRELVDAPLYAYTVSQYGTLTPQAGLYAPLPAGFQFPGATAAPVTPALPPPQPTPPSAYGQDLLLVGANGPGDTLPVAFTDGTGGFVVTDYYVGMFGWWARLPGVKRLAADFNHDGRTDVALIGGAGWSSIPIAMSTGDGGFTVVTQPGAETFALMAGSSNATPLVGDFNNDKWPDIALVGGTLSQSIPVAFSDGNGTFIVRTEFSPLAALATMPNVRPHVGDFNGDGFDDIALTGGAGWTTIPIAHSYGNSGTFLFTNRSVTVRATGGVTGIPQWNFAELARQPNVTVVAADFNKDGRTDLALAGGAGWLSMPLALGFGDGSFALSKVSIGDFPMWASLPGAKVLKGDFNGDGYADLALTGVANWGSLPIALNIGFGNFVPLNNPINTFASLAAVKDVRVITGDFNGDYRTDVALVGGAGWTSIPVAFSTGFGAFTTTSSMVARFPTWAAETAATVLVGTVN